MAKAMAWHGMNVRHAHQMSLKRETMTDSTFETLKVSTVKHFQSLKCLRKVKYMHLILIRHCARMCAHTYPLLNSKGYARVTRIFISWHGYG